MPRERLSMRKIRELLRLKFESGLSIRQISKSLRIGVGSAHDYLARVRVAGLSWPLPEDLTEEQLEARLFPAPVTRAADARPLPDWKQLDIELKRKGVTLRLLWEEYRIASPDGLGYSQFCKNFSDFKGTLDPRMRQNHKAGEKLFVDYAGLTVPLIDRRVPLGCGEIHQVQIFVATLGAGSYTFAEATLTQSIPDWIGSHRRAFAFFGGVPELLVCDNLKSGVTTPCRYEPDIQRTYEEMATHYGTAILPARIVKARDKAKVEAGVQSVEERMLAPLRNRQFFSLAEINQALTPLLVELNSRRMQGRDHSRADLFAQVDQPALKLLPAHPYEMGIWRRARVHIDYHIAVDDRFYSVPYTLLKQEVEVRLSGAVVEIYRKGERIASHTVVTPKYGRSTQDAHMPESHKQYAGWTPQRLLAWVENTGPYTRQVGESILSGHAHPQLGLRSCLGLIRLSNSYGAERMEAACRKAIAMHAPNYKVVKTILANNVDKQPDKPIEAPVASVEHQNIRGADYYCSASDTRYEA
jgi:transposase